jgi:probable phosphoglycerate mutase
MSPAGPAVRGRPTGRPTLLLLVRHGHTAFTGRRLPGRLPGIHLSAEGRRQAARLAERLRALTGIAAVYSSPLERARETAAAIARARGLPVRLEADLTEVDIGAWAGQPVARARQRAAWRRLQHHPSGFRFPGGESFTEMQARVVGALERLITRHPGEAVVAVFHADPIKAALAHALGLSLDLFQRLVIAPASVSVVACGTGGPLVLTVNSVDGDLSALLTP